MLAFVLQDSIMFNMSIRENIAFSNQVTDESLAKAIATAELTEFIHSLARRPEQHCYLREAPISPVDKSNASCWQGPWL